MCEAEPVNLRSLVKNGDVFRTLLNILEKVFCKNGYQLLAVNYFHKAFRFRCSSEFWIASEKSLCKNVVIKSTSKRLITYAILRTVTLQRNFSNEKFLFKMMKYSNLYFSQLIWAVCLVFFLLKKTKLYLQQSFVIAEVSLYEF